MATKVKVRKITKVITDALYVSETLAAFRNGQQGKGEELLLSLKKELMKKANITTALELEQLFVKHVGLYNWPEPIERTALCYALAGKFAEVLHRDLGRDTMNNVISLNRSYSDSACATSEFCDANMVMFEAWQAIVPMEFKASDEVAASLWNAAWEIAKRLEFHPIGINTEAAAVDGER